MYIVKTGQLIQSKVLKQEGGLSYKVGDFFGEYTMM